MAARRREPNNLLRQARGARTQAELAELANTEIFRRSGRQGSLTAKSVSDLERGWYVWPAKPTRDALCVVLGVEDPGALGFAIQRERPTVERAWLPPRIAVGADRCPADLPAIRAVSASLQSADRQLGGGHLYPAVVSYLRSEIVPQLADVSGPDLFAAAASFSEIAGWMSHDGGHDERAERHFAQAHRLARAADNHAVTANIRASMSHLAVQVDRPATAVQLADDGIGSLRYARSQSRLHARLFAMRARGMAALGDAHGCRSSLANAEDILEQSDDESRGEWVSQFDAAALASETAWCLHRLGDLAAAETNAHAAIELRDRDRVRSRSFAQLALAQILLASGSVDEAANLGDEVRATASTMTSARVHAQLVDLARALAPYGDSGTVSTFLERVSSMTPKPTLVEELR